MNEALHKLRPLDEMRRLEVRQQAQQAVLNEIGSAPQRSDFQDAASGDYPGWLTILVLGALVIVFVASFAMSIFRLFTAGRDAFLQGIADGNQAIVAGLAVFLMAEFTVIVSTLTRKVYFGGHGRAMWIPIGIGVVLAITGNWVVAQPGDFWGLLETLSPPVVVLFMSIIGEGIILKTLASRQHNERRYQQALEAWKAQTTDLTQHERFLPIYANMLRQAIWQINHGAWAGSADYLRALSLDDWRALVNRELQAEHWFAPLLVQPTPIVPEVAVPPTPLSSNGHRPANGHSIVN